MKTVNVTPTWSAALPMLLMVLERGTEQGKHAAREELKRMALCADSHVRAQEVSNGAD